LPEINTKEKVCSSCLLIIVILLFVPSGLGQFNGVALEVHAQRSSSCDRAVVSLVDCSPASSTSSSSTGDNNDDRDNNDGDNDEGNNDDDKNGEKKGGDIESKIPSTAGGGVPFP
jgi:hypothetical protein